MENCAKKNFFFFEVKSTVGKLNRCSVLIICVQQYTVWTITLFNGISIKWIYYICKNE